MSTLDETTNPASLGYAYFETAEPQEYEDPTTYTTATRRSRTASPHSWNHSLGEIITALLENRFTLTGFTEHDSVPWNALPGRMSADDAGEWRLSEHPNRLAASYTLQASNAEQRELPGAPRPLTTEIAVPPAC